MTVRRNAVTLQGCTAGIAMKVTVERALLESLGHVRRVVERATPSRSSATSDPRETPNCSLKATDLDLEVTETLAAETATGGATTVPAHVVRHHPPAEEKLPDGAQIVLEADGDRSVLAIRAGRSRCALSTTRERFRTWPPAT